MTELEIKTELTKLHNKMDSYVFTWRTDRLRDYTHALHENDFLKRQLEYNEACMEELRKNIASFEEELSNGVLPLKEAEQLHTKIHNCQEALQAYQIINNGIYSDPKYLGDDLVDESKGDGYKYEEEYRKMDKRRMELNDELKRRRKNE